MKLRKLAAVAMTSILAVTTLVACGNDEEETKSGSLKSSIESGMNMEKFTYEGKMGISMKGETFVGTVDEEVQELLGIKDNSLDMSITMKGKKAGNNAAITLGADVNGKVKADILELVQADGTSYVGVETLVNGVKDIYKTVLGEDMPSEVTEMIPDGKYLKVTEDMLEELLESIDATGSLNMAGAITEGASAADTEKSQELVKYLAELINKGIKKSESDAYTNDGDTYKLTINNDNLNAVVSGIADVLSSNSDEVCEKLSEILGEDGFPMDAASFKQTVELLKSYDVAAMLGCDIEFVMKSEYKDDTWNFSVSFNLSKDDEEIGFNFEYKAVKDDELTIAAPTDLVSDKDSEEIMSAISNAIEDAGDITTGGSEVNNDDGSGTGTYVTIDSITGDDTGAQSTKGISGKFSDAQVYYNGTILSIGKSKLGDMVSAGFESSSTGSDASGTIDSYSNYFYEKQMGTDFTVWTHNDQSGEVKAVDSVIDEIEASTLFADADDDMPDIYVMGDITFGSSDDDVLSVFGNPTSCDDYTSFTVIDYSYMSGDVEYNYEFTIADGLVAGITVSVEE